MGTNLIKQTTGIALSSSKKQMLKDNDTEPYVNQANKALSC